MALWQLLQLMWLGLKTLKRGSPLSLLLFSLAIELLTDTKRCDPAVCGIVIGQKFHKITLYADDVLLFLSNPTKSVNRLIEMIHLFSTFSSNEMNFSKSEAMSLRSQQQTPRSFTSSPLKWSLMGFVYLGIFTTSQFDQMFKAYLFNKTKQDLELYNSLPMSWLHSLLQINVLPHLLYPVRMIQI